MTPFRPSALRGRRALAFAIVTIGFAGVGAFLGAKDTGVPRHRGPEAAEGNAGPARFAKILYEGYDSERALADLVFIDAHYREPGNPGFELTIDRVVTALKEIGFGSDARLELDVIETPLRNESWSPVRGSIQVLAGDAPPRTLLAFGPGDDRYRTLLPTNAPSADVTGPLAFDLEAAKPGSIFVTDQPLAFFVRRAASRELAAVFSSRLGSYNVDPTGRERHRDAISYGRVPSSTTLPVAHISPGAHDTLRELAETNPELRVRFRAEVERRPGKLRTVVATVVGAAEPERVIPIACHVQEPGAVDNASGVAGLLEGARALAKALREGRVEWPRRSIGFVWGNEMQQSRIFLEKTERKPFAAFSADMIGASRKETGALPLLERDPDPGALRPLPPDFHTPWGAGKVTEERLRPNGLSLLARCALQDVARVCGGWETAEHPWEGGSDHDVFLRGGVPAVLFWCFTDFAYHTSLDRVEHIDAEVMRRMSVAILSGALALADPRPGDLERYLASLETARALRLAAAGKADDPALQGQWRLWFEGSEAWLRRWGSPPPK